MAKDILNIGGFIIKKRIGTGARSVIYLATDQQSKTDVALKRVILERPEDSRIFEQVQTEYKVSQRIDHPYVRSCHKLRKIRRLFMVKELLLSMELFNGKNLEDVPSLSLLDVLLVFRMVANGLNAMHQQGFVHCDVKPNNILLSKTGLIKIIDLGQSCKVGTVKPRIQGTPNYIAPEQVLRKPMVPKTDIFNLGATMYWALTGANIPTLIPKNRNSIVLLPPQRPRTPHELKRQVPPEVSNLVMECVQENPAQRPRNMMMVVSRLDLIVHAILAGSQKAENQA